jgi:hypothetical protein
LFRNASPSYEEKVIPSLQPNLALKLPVRCAALAVWLMVAVVAGTGSAGALEEASAAHEHGDDATAVRLLRPLAENGDEHAQFALGFIYDTAKGMPQDDAEAVKWYRKAADRGVVGAQYNLGAMYADGHGVPLDYVEAYKWLSVAASQFPAEKRDLAVKMRDHVASKMTPSQIVEAQKLARDWKPK